jgi:signal transduction histidine kinase/CheY-like chemotaxis protein
MKIFRTLDYRESFTARIFLVFSALTIIASLSFTLFFFRYQSRSLTEKLEGKGELLTTLLAHNSRLGIFTENADLLVAPVNSILEDPEVLSVSVFTSSGKKLISQHHPGKKSVSFANEWNTKVADDTKKSSSPILLKNEDAFTFWGRVAIKPVISQEEAVYFNTTPEQTGEQTIGYVHLTMDAGNLKKSLRSLLIDSIVIGMAFLLIGALITYFVSKGVTGPLNRLTGEVKSFSDSGEYRGILIDSRDEVGNLASAFNDLMTSLKKREEEKEELEEKLRHSQKMEAIGTLAGGVAHDFNNILMAIIGYGALLQIELPSESKLYEYVEEIIKAGDRASDLTQRLLAFTRKQIISPEPVKLDNIIVNIERLLTRLMTEDIEMSFKLEAGDAMVMADTGQIDQVLINLSTNARDALPRGGKIRISTSVTTPDTELLKQNDLQPGGEYALIRVEDNGVGIPENILQRIFDPFFTTKEVGKGTGLGLSMVYGIVKQHNGIISVESETNRGTTFSIYLPVIEPSVVEQQSMPPRLQKGKLETILVAEDDPSVRSFLKGFLETNGYRVITVSDGEEAVKEFVANRERIKLVLFDVIMPKKNGKEAFDEILRMEPGIKAIFVSGYTDDVIDWKCALKDDIFLIQKPVQPTLLLSKLREALDSE